MLDRSLFLYLEILYLRITYFLTAKKGIKIKRKGIPNIFETLTQNKFISMKKLASIAACLLAYTATFAGPPEPKVGFRWVLNKQYSDEFNGTSLDRSKWNNTFRQWKGRRPARFAPSAVSVKNGTMQIKNTLSKNPADGYTIDGGAVQSKEATAHFGYYECRFRASRISMSTTFWMSNGKKPVNFVTKKSNGQNCPKDRFSQELDIVESIGGVFNGGKSFRENMNFNTHYRYIDCNGGREKFYSRGNNAVEGNGQKSNSKLSSESWEEFHTYGAYWKNANEVDFYADNKQIGTVRPSTEVVDKPFPDPMQINMVTETYNWAKPYPSPQQLANNNINTSYYDWIRAYELVPIEKAPKATSFTAGRVFEESISFFASPQLKNGNKQVEVAYLYAANADRKFNLRVLDASNKEVANVTFNVLEGFGKNRKTVNLDKSLPNGNYTFIGETREIGSNKLIASTGKDVVVAPPTDPKPQPNGAPKVDFKRPTRLSYTEGANINVDVAATDADGIDNVRLYMNDKFVRQENISPYEWGGNDAALTNLKAGTYVLKAVATDKKGAKAEKSITLTVNKQAPVTPPVSNPVVNFAKPTTNLNLSEGSNMQVDVTATDADGIANVRLYLNGTFIRQENVNPYLWGNNDNALKNLKAGTYELKAVATDTKGDKGERSITFVVAPKNAPQPGRQIIADGVYSIKSSFSDQRLLGRAVEQYSARMHNAGTWADQQWIITHSQNNVYTIQNRGNGRYLSVKNNCVNAANVAVEPVNNSNFNFWEINKVGNNYTFTPVNCGGFSLDIQNGNTDGNVYLWKSNNRNRNQLFEILPVAGAKNLGFDISNIKIGPNPAQAYVDISGIPESGSIKITNLLGQQLISLIAETNIERISLSSFASGMYFVRINNGIPKRLVIAK